eukprot:Awhi_evm1s6008
MEIAEAEQALSKKLNKLKDLPGEDIGPTIDIDRTSPGVAKKEVRNLKSELRKLKILNEKVTEEKIAKIYPQTKHQIVTTFDQEYYKSHNDHSN